MLRRVFPFIDFIIYFFWFFSLLDFICYDWARLGTCFRGAPYYSVIKGKLIINVKTWIWHFLSLFGFHIIITSKTFLQKITNNKSNFFRTKPEKIQVGLARILVKNLPRWHRRRTKSLEKSRSWMSKWSGYLICQMRSFGRFLPTFWGSISTKMPHLFAEDSWQFLVKIFS